MDSKVALVYLVDCGAARLGSGLSEKMARKGRQRQVSLSCSCQQELQATSSRGEAISSRRLAFGSRVQAAKGINGFSHQVRALKLFLR